MNGKRMTRYQIIQDRFLSIVAYYPLVSKNQQTDQFPLVGNLAMCSLVNPIDYIPIACTRTIYKQMMTYKIQNRYDCHLGHVLLERGVGLTIEFSDRHDKKHRLIYDAVKDELTNDNPTN